MVVRGDFKNPDLRQAIGIQANARVTAGVVFLGTELPQNNELVVANYKKEENN